MGYVVKTDTGKVRLNNEDNGEILTNKSGIYLAIVADGMGGHNAGDIASEMAVNVLKEYWEKSFPVGGIDAAIAEKWLRDTIADVNIKLYEHSRTDSNLDGMGTTLVAAVCTNDFITIANIGDSRGYLLNENGFQQLTEDHTLVNALVKTGQISKEDAQHHPRKNLILKALGTEEIVEVDIKTILVDNGDCLLLCSDGLYDKLTDTEIKEMICKDGLTMEEKAQTMIDLANENGGEDNITIVLLDFPLPDESGCNKC
ncbi:protein phosphatase [Heyndrickxia shackletonii]|uniref:protein-serine/threonine phosphatase n=1 Tax=Heyndrickxia shackletonii TaxID=157838 RepID=A0A0Q3WZA3_9BACI|nr:Stp1/IreP family PP2C-type Ser/Thr phosphatase [Heyndrickxia shackletonii]KQL54679.1 protein phosphatase [Heyndrickxia shackletonii]MBB2478718.1 Stp1/IreP family PP2C-type Ser/Thr phosphatase [Bacillus sp. APMAM]NEY98329.1 Stp1/IreP family PP2C-type Ser/Thr phosphatase [Heyndrickxia shackletonii]RTZ57919.1 Stp1/IreP family PP2C-type Ser/Thr phosphatase [Bacillus sp. SAJ1]